MLQPVTYSSYPMTRPGACKILHSFSRKTGTPESKICNFPYFQHNKRLNAAFVLQFTPEKNDHAFPSNSIPEAVLEVEPKLVFEYARTKVFWRCGLLAPSTCNLLKSENWLEAQNDAEICVTQMEKKQTYR